MQLTVDSEQLPMGWIKTKLGDVCKKVEYGSSAKSKPEGKIPVLRMGNVQNGVIDWNDLVYTTDQKEIDKYLLKHNDILFNRTNSADHVGKTAIYKSERPAIFAGYLIRIHRQEDLIDADFLNYYLNSNAVREYGKSVMSRSVNQANINGTKLKEYPIILPPLPEQKRIVAILDEAFEGIDAAIANTEKNLANAGELFESYLNAIFTQKGGGWVEMELGEVCNFSQGIQVETKLQLETMTHDGLVRFLRIVDFTQGNEAPRYIENPGIKYIVNERDVSLVRYGASTGFVCRGLHGAIANNLFKVMPKQNNLTNEYIYYFLCSSTFQNEIKRVMGGAAMPAISFGLIKNIKIQIPSVLEQEAVVRRLNLFKIQTQHLENIYRQKLATLKELKQSILQKAFTCELTVRLSSPTTADTPKTVKEEIAA